MRASTRAEGLIDTGAILALLDRRDRWHRPCLEAYNSLRLSLATSLAVLTELLHLTSVRLKEAGSAWAFLRSGVVTVLPLDDRDLPALESLMRRYADRPMDFADATLVHLAAREGLCTIFPVDHADFETYRIEGRRRFRIVPAR